LFTSSPFFYESNNANWKEKSRSCLLVLYNSEETLQGREAA